MKKFIFAAALAAFLLAPSAQALTWQDLLGNTEFDCARGLFVFQGTGHGEITLTSRNAFVFVYEKNTFFDFERNGNVKWTDNMETWVYPTLFTRFRLMLGESQGTIRFDGQNRVLIFGQRDDMRLSGNYQLGSYIGPVSCPSS